MHTDLETAEFAENSRRALLNPQLQRALSAATIKFTSQRGAAVAEVTADDWQRLRDRARAIKEHTIANLDRYLDQFSSRVEELGGKVFWACDAAEANDYVTELAQRNNVKLAVKSKSMMTEEIELNRALARAGVEALETDLGEYIIQLAGERPSHIIAPAVHKTRGDVADLFAEKLHVVRTDVIEEMTALARTILRKRFAEAGMGVTGANFAVAETGTIVLVENEGNIRLTNSLPGIHVAVMGIEKVIPKFEDLAVFLRLLPRSATGQKMSSYVSFLTGVKSHPDEEGPRELHVVILDNGRTGMLANPHLRESLYCIRCGACLNTCPVYQKIGGHAYGWIYPGPIGAVITPQLVGRDQAAQLPFASSLCGACRDVCPIKINLPDMLLHLRHEIKEEPNGHSVQGTAALQSSHTRGIRHRLEAWAERLAFKLFAAVMKTESRYQRATELARLAEQAFGPASLPLLSRWTAGRAFPPAAATSFRDQWRNRSSSGAKGTRSMVP